MTGEVPPGAVVSISRPQKGTEIALLEREGSSMQIYREAAANRCEPGAADVLVFGAGYSLLKPVRSFVTVKLPSVHADSLMKCAGWFVGVESRFAMN